MIGRVLAAPSRAVPALRRGAALAFCAVLCASLTLAGATASAQDDDDYDEEFDYSKDSASYVELMGSFAFDDDEDEETGGVGAIIGGHVTPWLAMEGQYEYVENEDTHLVSYQLKWVPLQGRIQPFVKAGLGLMGGRPSHPFLFMGRFGAGVSFFLNEQLAVVGSGSIATARYDSNFFLGSIGVAYFFE